MKMNWKKLAPTPIIAVLILTGAAACLNTNIVKVEVKNEEFVQSNDVSRSVSLSAGDMLKVALGSMVMGDFHWTQTARIDDDTILKQVDYSFDKPEGEGVGALASESWTFEAEKSGQTRVFMSFAQPWRSDIKGEWTFTLAVAVK
jgi:predicted secreted protein